MEYLFISFIAGVLTILAPCVFTLLPVILGGSLTGKSWKKPLTIITSLSVSIFVFTLILKSSTLLINIHPDFWKYISGGIILVFGIFTLFPDLWGKINLSLGLSTSSDKLMNKAAKKRSFIGDILLGASLGPVFSSCSPTYAIIIATILPLDLFTGVVNLLAYILGLALVLIIVSIFGQKVIKNAKWAVNPNGLFKRVIGVIFIIIGISIFTGFDKKFETFLLDQGILDVTQIEINLLEKDNISERTDISLNVASPYPAPEITGITEWINSNPLTIQELKGKVVLIDFWTYSCINCIRTLPYVTSWYDKYKDDGLVIIGMHSPEFAFEKISSNVENAVDEYKINYPVALDNNFATWRAFSNRYWPATYFIGRNGNVVHTHFGEGNYEENEAIIQHLLGIDKVIDNLAKEPSYNRNQTAETYLGFSRFGNFLNTTEVKANDVSNFTRKNDVSNSWSLEGDWLVTPEHIVSKSPTSKLKLNFNAKEVYLVMGSATRAEVVVKVFKDDTEVSSSIIEVTDYDLYTIVSLPEFSFNYRLEIISPENIQMNAFTFGS